jgi:hypothetical protein
MRHVHKHIHVSHTAVDLARVDFVEQLAHDKRVEKQRQVHELVLLLRETRSVFGAAKNGVGPVQAEKVDDKLESRLAENVLFGRATKRMMSDNAQTKCGNTWQRQPLTLPSTSWR